MSDASILGPGAEAPDFDLRSSDPDETVSLSALRGRPVVLAFYPLDWSPVCRDQLTGLNEALRAFQELGADVLGISVDSAYCHAAFAADRNLGFRLLADFEPKGAVARAYGAYHQGYGEAERALFLVDGTGIIRWSYLSHMDLDPGVDGVLAALEELTGRKHG